MFELPRLVHTRLFGVVLTIATAVACDDSPDFNEPGPGDFVQFIQPGDGETLTAETFRRRPIAIVINFFPAEGFGFGALQNFRFDGEEVRDRVLMICEPEVCGSGPPPDRVSLTFEPGEPEAGGHTVEVVYSDSRGTVHRVRWSFTIEG